MCFFSSTHSDIGYTSRRERPDRDGKEEMGEMKGKKPTFGSSHFSPFPTALYPYL